MVAVVVVAVLAITFVSLYTDIRYRKIPNWLTISAAAGALAVKPAMSLALVGSADVGWVALDCILGVAAAFGLLFPLWVLRAVGAGDVKMAMGIGAWLGPIYLMWMLAASSLFIILCNLGMWLYLLLAGREGGSTLDQLAGREKARGLKAYIPYAVPASLGAWSVLAWMVFKSGAVGQQG